MSGDSVDNSISKTTNSYRNTENCLKNWTTWLERWQAMSGKIGKKNRRPPARTLMSNLDHVLAANQDKELLRYAKIETHFDKYRGKPDFWKLPYHLHQKPCQPQYFAFQTKSERYIVPVFELVGYAQPIRDERHVVAKARKMCSAWQRSEYRAMQMIKYTRKIENILPHEPSMTQLIIVGEKIKNELTDENADDEGSDDTSSEAMAGSSELEHQEENDSKSDVASTSYTNSRSTLEFRLNGIPFDELSDLAEDNRSNARILHLKFEHDLSLKEPNRQFIRLENTGHVTLRFNWTQKDKHKLFQKVYYPLQEAQHGFCFNKNELLILPGQTIDFPIWFCSDRPGSFAENWEITTRPKMWDDEKVHLILALHCYCYDRAMQDKLQSLLNFIEAGRRDMQIRSVLEDLTKDLKYEDKVVAPCAVNEAQLFETENSLDARRTYIAYHRSLCRALKQFYSNLRGIEAPREWNLSIKQLRCMAHKADVGKFLDLKQEMVRQMVAELKEPPPIKAKASKAGKKDKKAGKKEKKAGKEKKSKKGKKGAVKEEEKEEKSQVQVINETFVYDNRRELERILQDFDYPVLENRNRLKYAYCYTILGSYFTKMTSLLGNLERKLNVEKFHSYPKCIAAMQSIKEAPERLVYERFDCDYLVVRPIALDKQSKFDRPKSKKIAQVPLEDIEQMYSVYFDRPISSTVTTATSKSGKKEKGKKKEAKDKKKKKGGSKSDKKSKDSKKKAAKVVEADELLGFDPYEEVFVYEAPQIEEISDDGAVGKDCIPDEIAQDYKRESYLIVYSCLSDAVDCMVDTINAFECTVGIKTLDDIINCRHE